MRLPLTATVAGLFVIASITAQADSPRSTTGSLTFTIQTPVPTVLDVTATFSPSGHGFFTGSLNGGSSVSGDSDPGRMNLFMGDHYVGMHTQTLDGTTTLSGDYCWNTSTPTPPCAGVLITVSAKNSGKLVYDGTVGDLDDLVGKADEKLTISWGHSKLTLSRVGNGDCTGELRTGGQTTAVSCTSSGTMLDGPFVDPKVVVYFLLPLLLQP